MSAILLLAACGQAEVAPTAVADTPTFDLTEGDANSAVETNNTVVSPRPEVTITASSDQTDANGIPVGFTAEGRPYRGNPDAPIVMEEFSDFQ